MQNLRLDLDNANNDLNNCMTALDRLIKIIGSPNNS